MSEEFGEKGERLTRSHRFNWSSLREFVDEPLLMLLRDELINRRHNIALNSIKGDSQSWLGLFRALHKHQCYERKITQIDWQFLAALQTIHTHIAKSSIYVVKSFFQRNPESEIFSNGLQLSDFPNYAQKGIGGKNISKVLSTALTRSACVEVLARCHEAYSDGKMDIGLYSFANLAFTVYVRPESYRLIRLGDLKHDTKNDRFGIWIYPVKQHVAAASKIYYDLPSSVGLLLLKQRMDVILKYGHLVTTEDHHKLALFPANALNSSKTAWQGKYTNENFGLHRNSAGIIQCYFAAIKSKLQLTLGLTATALRHTIATQLALHGCSAKTIQAVLKHASDKTCRKYVDIAFHGLIHELSDALHPAFNAHLPVIKMFRTKDDALNSAESAIFSEDITTGETIFQGECGKQIRCEHAPFTCYGCSKFIPCFDADHELNLNIVTREIDDFSNAGQPYKAMVDRWTRVKYDIQMVISACKLYQARLQQDMS
ncbi:tyrosine-type recombinase/integrase [Undibacterium sp.]|uniref:tyrosine-type recombinase/integrase n=1 Tax=Undibacterium sp. TaxID=1914977 RepID=UPI00272ACAB4|nr:tyrosine-type recombinase/integrase [Undibacterium sp.]